MFLSKYSLDRNNTIGSLFRTQYTPEPDFLIAVYYGLRNTIFWVTEDLASGWSRINIGVAAVLFWSNTTKVNFS
jgi:hypothetical protein